MTEFDHKMKSYPIEIRTIEVEVHKDLEGELSYRFVSGKQSSEERYFTPLRDKKAARKLSGHVILSIMNIPSEQGGITVGPRSPRNPWFGVPVEHLVVISLLYALHIEGYTEKYKDQTCKDFWRVAMSMLPRKLASDIRQHFKAGQEEWIQLASAYRFSFKDTGNNRTQNYIDVLSGYATTRLEYQRAFNYIVSRGVQLVETKGNLKSLLKNFFVVAEFM